MFNAALTEALIGLHAQREIIANTTFLVSGEEYSRL